MEAAQAPTPCSQRTFSFQAIGSRRVEVDFSGGYLSSDGGSVLLREVDGKGRLTSSPARCFSDHRFEPLAAQLSVSVRRVHIRLCSASPIADAFAQAHANLQPSTSPG